VLKCLVRAAEQAGVRVECNVGVQRLILDSGGAVVGVEARRFGTVLRVRARRGVVLTTGGFVYNDDMLKRHCPAMLAVSKLADVAGHQVGRAAAVIGHRRGRTS
jgi:3-oxo-5alpha-steroid 4-dehydrogenase